MFFYLVLIVYVLLSAPTEALYATSGGPCYSTCNGTKGTNSFDLVCSDGDYGTTTPGRLMQQCLECEAKTTFVNGTNSDEYWFLFHMKYTQQACLIDSTSKTGQVIACSTYCDPLSKVLDKLWINSSPFVPQYDYCSYDSNSYTTYGPDCAKCLQAQQGSVILGNYVRTMLDACDTQPLAVNAQLVSTTGDLFATSTIATTTSSSSSTSATSTASVTSQSAISTIPPAVSGSATSGAAQTALPTSGSTSGAGTQSSGLSTGASVGIGVGVGLLGAAAIAGLLYFFCFRRRRNQHPNRSIEAKPNQGSSAIYSEIGQSKPVRDTKNQPELYSHNVYEAPDGLPQHYSAAELPASNKNRV